MGQMTYFSQLKLRKTIVFPQGSNGFLNDGEATAQGYVRRFAVAKRPCCQALAATACEFFGDLQRTHGSDEQVLNRHNGARVHTQPEKRDEPSRDSSAPSYGARTTTRSVRTRTPGQR
jgi:hypothetical protein